MSKITQSVNSSRQTLRSQSSILFLQSLLAILGLVLASFIGHPRAQISPRIYQVSTSLLNQTELR